LKIGPLDFSYFPPICQQLTAIGVGGAYPARRLYLLARVSRSCTRLIHRYCENNTQIIIVSSIDQLLTNSNKEKKDYGSCSFPENARCLVF